MNRKIFQTGGTLLLLVAGALAVKASIKRSQAPDIYYTKGSAASCTLLISGNPAAQFTTAATGTPTQAAIKTVASANTVRTLWATSGCTTKKVYFKP